MGYHSGNWTYEWTKLGMSHKRSNELKGEEAADELFNASLCFSIAGYPHLKNDNLATPKLRFLQVMRILKRLRKQNT